MLRLFTLLPFVLSSALAQSSTSDSNSTTNPLIPSNINSECSQFLNDLNNNSTIATCTTSLLSATKQFGPGGTATSASSTDIKNALDSICSSSVANTCPESVIRGKLAEFYSKCPAELTTNPNTDVLNIYDVMYALSPLRSAICSEDDNGDRCVLQKTSSSGLQAALASGSSSDPQNNVAITSPLQRRAASTVVITPNMTMYRETNLLFLFLQPSLENTTLCTTCTRQISNAYFNFETVVPFAPGISKSNLIGGQLDLYQAIQNKCGSNFLQTNIQAAGGISGSTLFSGAAPTASSPGPFIPAALSFVTLVVAFMF
ncbi:hypothetical protein AX15_004749 [Amanita polypyramis BW_CC]|nr:hypothetical protein AX15_004749 [Amanita polypyramis BW_CC]